MTLHTFARRAMDGIVVAWGWSLAAVCAVEAGVVRAKRRIER